MKIKFKMWQHDGLDACSRKEFSQNSDLKKYANTNYILKLFDSWFIVQVQTSLSLLKISCLRCTNFSANNFNLQKWELEV